jgi:serine/threonine protein phosphatase PrpC
MVRRMATRHYGFTDVGRVRAHNEDAFLADAALGLFVVCDGVGGRARGEIASQETVEFICDFIKGDATDIEVARAGGSLDEAARVRLAALVRGAIQSACYMVHTMGEMDPERRGMSTTASVVLITGAWATVGWVGDSRVYLGHAGEHVQLTDDHTLVNFQIRQGLMTPEEARLSRLKHVITRAVGHREFVEVDTRQLELSPGDKLLLCSDGLHEYIEDDPLLTSLFDMPLDRAAREAVRHANDCGGRDNITALFVEYTG